MNPQNSPTPSGLAGGGTEIGATLADAKNQINQGARDAAAKVKTVASQTAARAKEEAQRFANTQKESAAGRLGSFSSAIHETAQSLEDKDPNIAWFSHQAADKLQGIAEYMRSRDLNALRQDAEGLARRHPAAFFGGMFLAGLVIGNVVKASRRKLADTEGSPRDMEYESEWMQNRGDQGASAQGGVGGLGGLGETDLTQTERNAAGL